MTGTVYFLSAENGMIKAGYSSNFKKRFRALVGMCPVKLEVLAKCYGTRTTERMAHDMLSDFHVSGEWFTDCEEARERVAEFVNRRKSPVPDDTSQDEGCQYVAEAVAIAKAIWVHLDDNSDGETADRMARVDAAVGLLPGTIWGLVYRPPQGIGVTKYLQVVEAGIRAEAIALSNIRAAFAHAHAIAEEFRSLDERVKEAERAVGAAEALLGQIQSEDQAG